jgi:CTP:molybdopterin cytidylyltransferase MocA
VIPAAGRGRRIGGPKALLTYAGEPLAVHVARTFLAAGCPRVVVVLGAGADELEPALGALPRVTTVRSDPDAPMLASVLAGLAAAPEADLHGVLVHAVDAPRVKTETVLRLLATREAEPEADGLVAACGGRRGHPLWLAACCVAELRGATADHPDGLRGWIRAHGLRIVAVETGDAAVLDDVDTPEQLALLRSGAGEGAER